MEATYNLGIKFESKNMNQVLSDLDRMKKSITDITNLNKNVSSQATKSMNSVRNLSSEIKKNGTAIKNNAKSQSQLSNSLNNTNQSVTGFRRNYNKLTKSIKNIVIWGTLSSVIYGTVNSFKEGIETIEELDEKMTQLNRVTELTTQQLNEMKQSAIDIGQEFGQTVPDVLSSMIEWSKAGRSMEEAMALSRTAMLASNVAFMSAADAVKYLTSTTLQFGISASKSEQIIDRWNEVAKNYAVTGKALAEAIQMGGAAARSSGLSIDEYIGQVTALSAATNQTGSMIGNTLKTLYSRLGGSGSSEGIEALGKVESQLNKVGIALRSSKDSFRSTQDVLRDLSLQWDTLTEVQQKNLAYALGGRRKFSTVIALMDNYKMAVDATKTSLDSEGSALRENIDVMEAIAKQKLVLISTANKLADTLGESGLSKILLGLVKSATGVLDVIESLVSTFNDLNGIMKILVSGAGVYGLIKGINKLRTATIALETTTTATTMAQKGFLAVLSPQTLAIMGVVTAVGIAVSKFSEYKNRMEKVNEQIEVFNKLTKNSNEMSLVEVSSTVKTLDKFQSKIKEYNNMVEEYRKLNNKKGVGFFSNFTGLTNLEDERFKELKSDLLDYKNEIMDMGKSLNVPLKLKYEGSYPIIEQSEKMNKVISGIRENALKNIEYNKQLTKEEFESTWNIKKKNEELMNSIDIYKKLNGQSNLTTNQQTKLQLAMQKLRNEFEYLKIEGTDWDLTLKQIYSNLEKNNVSAINTSIDKLNNLNVANQNVISNLKQESLGLSKSLMNTSITQSVRKQFEERLNNVKKELQARKDLVKFTEEKIEMLSGKIIFKEFFAKMSEDKFKDLKKTFEDGLINPINEFYKQFLQIQKQFEAGEFSLNIKKNLFNLSDLDYNKQLQNLLKTSVTGSIDLLANLKVSDLSSFENMLNNSIMGASGERKKELEQLKEQLNTIKEIKGEQNKVGALAGLIKNYYTSQNEELDKINNKVSLLTVADSLEGYKKLDFSNIALMDLNQLEKINSLSNDNKKQLDSWKQQLLSIDKTKLNTKDYSRYSEILNYINSQIKNIVNAENEIGKNIDIKNLQQDINKEYQNYLTDIQNIDKKIQLLNSWKDKAILDGLDTSKINKMIDIEKGKKALLEYSDQLNKVKEQISNISDITKGELFSNISFNESKANIINNLNRILESARNNYTEVQLKQLKEQIKAIQKMSSKEFKKWQEENQEAVRDNIDNIVSSFQQGLNSVNRSDFDNIQDYTASAIKQGVLGALASKELSKALSQAITGSKNSNSQKRWASGIQSFAQAKSQGSSVGNSFMQGIGSAISVTNPVVGGIVSATGSIFESVFGGERGISSQVIDNLKEALDNAKSFLENYNLESLVPELNVHDSAGFFTKLFGGNDLSANTKEIEDWLNENYNRIKQTISDLNSGIEDAITSSTNYNSLYQSFYTSIGETLQSALMDAVLSSSVMTSIIGELTLAIENAVEDAYISSAEMENIKSIYEGAKGSLDSAYNQVQDLMGEFDLNVEQDNSTTSSFSAGSSSSISNSNYFQIYPNMYTGDQIQMEETAKQLEPYITEIQREQGA